MTDQPTQENDQPVDEGLTKIVSYLDGELNETQMNEVEDSLINDPDMRSHADILSRTWALLDALEETPASQTFTEDTLKTVSMDSKASETQSSTARNIWSALARYHVLPCFLLGLLVGVAGLNLGQKNTRRKESETSRAVNRTVLDHFELVRNADQYSVIPDVEQLRSLNLPASSQTSEGATD